MQTVQVILAAALLSIVTLSLAWDIYVGYARAGTQTVSRALYEWSRDAPNLLLLVGIGLGHLFFPLQIRDPKGP